MLYLNFLRGGVIILFCIFSSLGNVKFSLFILGRFLLDFIIFGSVYEELRLLIVVSVSTVSQRVQRYYLDPTVGCHDDGSNSQFAVTHSVFLFIFCICL